MYIRLTGLVLSVIAAGCGGGGSSGGGSSEEGLPPAPVLSSQCLDQANEPLAELDQLCGDYYQLNMDTANRSMGLREVSLDGRGRGRFNEYVIYRGEVTATGGYYSYELSDTESGLATLTTTGNSYNPLNNASVVFQNNDTEESDGDRFADVMMVTDVDTETHGLSFWVRQTQRDSVVLSEQYKCATLMTPALSEDPEEELVNFALPIDATVTSDESGRMTFNITMLDDIALQIESTSGAFLPSNSRIQFGQAVNAEINFDADENDSVYKNITNILGGLIVNFEGIVSSNNRVMLVKMKFVDDLTNFVRDMAVVCLSPYPVELPLQNQVFHQGLMEQDNDNLVQRTGHYLITFGDNAEVAVVPQSSNLVDEAAHVMEDLLAGEQGQVSANICYRDRCNPLNTNTEEWFGYLNHTGEFGFWVNEKNGLAPRIGFAMFMQPKGELLPEPEQP